jgi:hypothetical protein
MPDDPQTDVPPPPKDYCIPIDLTVLGAAEFEAMMDSAFLRGCPALDAAPDSVAGTDMRTWRRLLYSVGVARRDNITLQNVIAVRGRNMAKPKAEAEVLFLVASLCQDLVLDGVEGCSTAGNLLAMAVGEVALSRAGKLDLDVASWAQRAAAVEAGKKLPMPTGPWASDDPAAAMGALSEPGDLSGIQGPGASSENMGDQPLVRTGTDQSDEDNDPPGESLRSPGMRPTYNGEPATLDGKKVFPDDGRPTGCGEDGDLP